MSRYRLLEQRLRESLPTKKSPKGILIYRSSAYIFHSPGEARKWMETEIKDNADPNDFRVAEHVYEG